MVKGATKDKVAKKPTKMAETSESETDNEGRLQVDDSNAVKNLPAPAPVIPPTEKKSELAQVINENELKL